jgi:hypothetical protein
VKDEERRDRELQIYSQELGIPLDWFALKRKEKMAEAKKKYGDEVKALKQAVAAKRGMIGGGATDRSAVSAVSSFSGGDSHADASDADDSYISESDISFTSGSSYSYMVDDEEDHRSTDDERTVIDDDDGAASRGNMSGTTGSPLQHQDDEEYMADDLEVRRFSDAQASAAQSARTALSSVGSPK